MAKQKNKRRENKPKNFAFRIEDLYNLRKELQIKENKQRKNKKRNEKRSIKKAS